MAYRRRNRLRRRNARPSTKRAFKRTGRRLKGVSAVAYRRPGYSAGGMGGFGSRLGVVGRQRNAARAAQLMQRRVRRTRAIGGGELSFRKERFGRFRQMTIPKLLKVGFNKVVYRFQGVNRLNANATGAAGPLPPGFFRLHNEPAAASGYQQCPIHVYDLMNLPQVDQTGQTIQHAMAFSSNTTTGTGANAPVVWTSGSGQKPDGTLLGGNGFFPEDSYSPGNTTINTRFVQHDWFDFRFVLHGCTAQPTYYDIMLVRYTRDHLQPVYAAPSSQEDKEQYGSYWEGMTKNLLYNPILFGRKDQFKGHQVLRRYRVVLQPTRNDENDANPNMKVFKFRYQGEPSEILEPIEFEGIEIRSLKHGNTGHILYYAPSEAHEWEYCWTMDLQTAKNGILKYKRHLTESVSVPE